MILEYIKIPKENLKSIPYKFSIELENKEYIVTIRWNMVEEKMYSTIEMSDKTPVVSGRKLVLDKGLFENVDSSLIPENKDIVPLALTKDAEQIGITLSNLNEEVKLYLVEV